MRSLQSYSERWLFPVAAGSDGWDLRSLRPDSDWEDVFRRELSDLYTLSKWMMRLEVWVEVNNRIVRPRAVFVVALRPNCEMF